MNNPISDADLAALLDGRLDGAERDRVLRALSRTEGDEREVLAIAAEVLLAMEAPDTPPPIPPPPTHVAAPIASGTGMGADVGIERSSEAAASIQGGPPSRDLSRAPSTEGPRWGRRQIRAAGVTVTLGLVCLVLYLAGVFRANPPAVDAGTLARAFVDRTAGLPPAWLDSLARVRRGATNLPEARRGARVGALLVDLEVAAAGGDTAAVVRAAADVQALMSGVPGGGPVSGMYGAIVAHPRPTPERLRRSRAGLAGLLDEAALQRGMWLEAVRLAAARRDAGVLRAEGLREAATAAADDATLPPAIRELAAEVVRAGADGAAPDWTRLATLGDAALEAASS